MKLFNKPKFPRLEDVATGKHFGRFIETFEDIGQKKDTYNVKYHPSGGMGPFKDVIIKNVPKNGGLLRVSKIISPDMVEESIYFLLMGENGKSPIYGDHMKTESIRTTNILQGRINVLQAQLAATHKSELIASRGVQDKLREHQETSKIMKDKKPSIPGPYSRSLPTQVDEEEEL